MKLVCNPYCSNEYAIDSDLLFLEIDPSAAKLILRLHGKCRAFLKKLEKEETAVQPYGHVSLRTALRFDVIGAVTEPHEQLRDSIEFDEWFTVPDSFQPFVQDERGNESNVSRTECHALMLFKECIAISALSKYCSDRYETRDLSIDMLQDIASGRQPEEVTVFEAEKIPSDTSKR